MIRLKHIDVKRHSMCFSEIETSFSVSSLILNLFASEIGVFFLPRPLLPPSCHRKKLWRLKTTDSNSGPRYKLRPCDFSILYFLILQKKVRDTGKTGGGDTCCSRGCQIL